MAKISDPMTALYEALTSRGIRTTDDLVAAGEEAEVEVARHLHAIWKEDLIEPIRTARIKKFAVYLDAPLTDLVVKHAASYADYAFFVTQAVTTKTPSIEADPLGRGESLRTLAANPGDWLEGAVYRFPVSFVGTLLKARDVVDSGKGLVIPTYLDGYGIGQGKLSYGWPVVRDWNTIDINLTKFRDANPLLYAGEQPTAYLELLVPVLTGVPLDVVLKVRRDEEEAFARFTRRFFGMVKDYEETLDSEQAVIEAIAQVDEAVRKLGERFDVLRRTALRGYGEAGVTLGLTCLALLVPEPLSKLFAAFFGGAAGAKALKSFGTYATALDEMRLSDFYVPWRMTREAE